MRRKKKDAPPSRIWTFGCHPPTSGLAILIEQLRLATFYWNTLVPIELGRRRRVRKAMAAHPDVAPMQEHLAALDAEIKALQEALKARRRDARSRVDSEADRVRIRVLVTEAKAVRAALKVAKGKIKNDPTVAAEIEAANDESDAAVKVARAGITEKGLYWGTYLLVERAMEQARSGKMDPNYHGNPDIGRIGVQLQGGLPAAGLFKEDQRIRIAPVPEEAWTSKVQGERRRLCRTAVMIRVGSEGRAPIWATLPTFMHRKLPDDAVVKWAWVKREKIGPRYRYELQIVSESREFGRDEPTGKGAVAVDIGWRVMKSEDAADALRVAYLVDDTGGRREIQLPAGMPKHLRKSDELRKRRDDRFNEVRELLLAYMRSATKSVPDWLTEATRTLPYWGSCARLRRVFETWKGRRWKGDESIFAALEAWNKKEWHLWTWEAFGRDQTLAHRKDFYRNIAHQIAKTYAAVVLENFDLSKMARLPKPEGKAKAPQAQRRNRHATALSEFRETLISACKITGAKIIRVPAAYTTIDCYKCHARMEWDPAPKVDHRCAACGAEWDQDYNAGVNMLRLAGFEPPVQDNITPPSAPTPTIPAPTVLVPTRAKPKRARKAGVKKAA